MSYNDLALTADSFVMPAPSGVRVDMRQTPGGVVGYERDFRTARCTPTAWALRWQCT